MEIVTERCRIRKLRMEDAADLHEVLSDKDVMKHIETVFDFERTKEFIRSAGMAEPPLVYAVVWKKTEKVIGHVIFHPYDRSAYEIGWILNKDYWGMGIADEVTKGLMEYARHSDIVSCVIEFDEAQKISEKIARRNGFSYEGKEGNIVRYRLVF